MNVQEMDENDVEKLKIFVWLMVGVAFVGAVLHIPNAVTNTIIQWLVGLFVGSVCSLVAGSLVEAVSGDLLKQIALNIKIMGFEVSITVFAIVTFIVKIWLFGF